MGRFLAGPCIFSFENSVLPGCLDFGVALAAIDRSVFTWLEGDFGLFAALSAHSGEHLATTPAGAFGSVTLSFPCLTARWATLWLVGVSLGLEELLFRRGKGKTGAAIETLERLVLKTHG